MTDTKYISWGAKVSPTFLQRVRWLVDDLKIGHDSGDGMSKLLACMAWESGRTFSPSVRNMAGSGATGLIQFMPSTAQSLGTTTDALAAMTAEDQLNYVWKYFEPFKGKLKELSDLYMAILWPAGVGKPETYVLWDKDTRPTTYRQNSGLDRDGNGVITKAEASAKVTAVLVEGMDLGNVLVYSAAPATTQAASSLSPVLDSIADRIAREAVQVSAPVVEAITEAALEVATEVVVPAASVVAEAGKTVTKTADTVTTVVVQPNTRGEAIKEALSGWQGNLAGVLAVVGALLMDPTFAAKLGAFTTSLATGNGRWGALATLVGAALIAYRHRPGASL